MEFGASMLSSLAASGGAAQAGGGAAKAGGGGSGGSLAGSIVSGTASLLQMAQLRRAGREKAQALNLQADDTVTDVARENIQGTENRNSLRRALLQTIGERDVAYAASGVDISFGTPQIVRDQSTVAADRALAIDDAGTTSRVSRLNEKAANLRLMARSARRSANEQADIAGLGALGSLLSRG